jgi:hypothetical protein
MAATFGEGGGLQATPKVVAHHPQAHLWRLAATPMGWGCLESHR